MGRCYYCWLAAVAASMALSAGCTSQTTAPSSGAPLGGRWWVTTTSPTSSGATTAAEQAPLTGFDAKSATGRTNGRAGMETPAQRTSPSRQLTEAVTQNPVSQAVGGAVGRSAAWVKATTAKLRQPRVQSSVDVTSLAYKSPPPGASLYVAMARLNEQGGKVEQAVSLYEKALEKDPDNLEAMLGMAHLLDREGRFELAIEQYRKAEQAHPDDPAAHNDFGLCYARNGDMDDAITQLTQAVTLRPQSKLYRNNLATVLVERNRNDEALEHLTAAHGKSVAHYNLGVLLHQRGHDALASEQFAAALQINPKLEPARTWLARLGRQSAPIVPPRVDPGQLALEGRAARPGLHSSAGPQGSPVIPGVVVGPAIGNSDPVGGALDTGTANSATVPSRPVYPETWRRPDAGDGPVHLPALRGPEQAVLPPTPNDLQRYPTSGLPSGPRPY